MPRARRTVSSLAALTATALGLTGLTTLTAAQAPAAPPRAALATQVQLPVKQATATGYGGAVSSVDPDATAVGVRVLRRGGNAVDAAVATAAALGVTEPYSAGIGGGGFFVYYNARTGRVRTIDGRETAPASMQADAFVNPATGQPYPFAELVTSGRSVGVPGTAATWDAALDKWGTLSLRKALEPAAQLAARGFVVDDTFRLQTLDNKSRFAQIPPTAKLFLPNGDAPVTGSVFRNPELAATYRTLGRDGVRTIYGGKLGREIQSVVKAPPKAPDATLPVFPGSMEMSDLRAYDAIDRAPTKAAYRGLDVYSMAPPSSGGTTVGEALQILRTTDLGAKPTAGALHWYLEASALAFADRNAYVGDPDYVNVPTAELTSRGFGAERACQVDPAAAKTKPLPPGVPDGSYAGCQTAAAEQRPDSEGLSTTHLTTADRWGNVVAYTLTIEQTGGAGITVPGRGFLLNNELTDFSAVPNKADPNIIAGGKRPRSSMSPTIVLRHGKPVLAVGSPGGSTIITTVLQVLVNRLDLGMSLPQAIAAPRASQRNTAAVTAEQAFIGSPDAAALRALGHTFVAAGPPGSSAAEIGATTGIEFLGHGKLLAAAEPQRRGGGSAGVVYPR